MKFADAVYRPGFASVIDTHCHYNLSPIWDNWRHHWQQAQAKQVLFSWIPGTDLETSRRAIELARQESTFTAFIGIHPGSVAESEFDLEITLSQLRRMREQARATGGDIGGVGEIGLDYFRLQASDAAARAEQRLWLRRQLHMANEWNLPVILHVRDRETPESPTPENAYWDVVSIIEEIGVASGEFTLHCVSGPKAYVARLVALGAYAGFDGNLTYPNAHAIRELWRLVPAERRLLETDAPYLPPQEHRGEVCEPWMITETSQFIQENLV